MDKEIAAYAAMLLPHVTDRHNRRLLCKSKALPARFKLYPASLSSAANKYDELCKKRSLLYAHGIESLAIENGKANNLLSSMVRDRRFRDMIRVSTPHAHTFLFHLQRKAEIPNQYQRKAYLYLQRATMKTDTAGSYGPIAFGRFDYSSEKNFVTTTVPKVSSVMIEPWALNTLLDKMNVQKSFMKFFEVALKPNLLLNEGHFPPSFKQLINLIVQYAKETDPLKRDKQYDRMCRLFHKITGIDPWIRSREREEIATSYEGRCISFEIANRDFCFSIGSNLRDDVIKICENTGLLLAISISKMVQRLRDRGICSISNEPEDIKRFEETVSDSLDIFLEQSANEVEKGSYSISNQSDYPAPPVFSIDLAISSPSLEAVNRNEYKIILSEIHVAPAFFTVPFWVSDHEKILHEVTSAISRLIGNSKASLVTGNFDLTKTFKGNYREFVFKTCLEAQNQSAIVSSAEKELQWFQGAKPNHPIELSNILFFPLSIGSNVRIFEKQIDSLTFKDGARILWTQEKLPKLVQKVIKRMDPQLAKRISTREFMLANSEPIPAVARKTTPSNMFSWLFRMWRWKEKLGLPSRLFAWCSPSDKPIFIDFAIPHSLHELYRLRGRSLNLPLVVSPLSPSEENFVLEDSEGKYASEIRLMAFPAPI